MKTNTLKDALNFSYYYEPNGELDEGVGLIGDCLERNIYVILKYQYRIPNLFCLFFNDFTFYFSQHADGRIHDFGVKNANNFLSTIVSSRRIELKGHKGVLKMEKMLDQGEIFAVQTIIERMPFWQNYLPDFKLVEDYIPFHAFVMIGHDQENYYYVENPYNINPTGFVPYKDNKEIGVLPKRKVNDILEYYLNLFTFQLNKVKSEKVDNQIRTVIQGAIPPRAPEMVDNRYIFYGRDAIMKLIEICDNEVTRLNFTISTYRNTNLQGLIRWKIAGETFHRRKMLYACLPLYFKNQGLVINESLMKTLTSLIDAWYSVFNILELKYQRQEYLLDAKIGDYFRKILVLEDQLIAALSEIFS